MYREQYTPGHTANAVGFMAKRTLDSHGAFFLPALSNGMAVLDCGCGPGSITCDIAERFPGATVVGVDADESQILLAAENARIRGLLNVKFRVDSAYDLSFRSRSFDAVFSHALLEHLREPDRAAAEFHRVLRPGGVVGVCSPDWGGFLLSPPSTELTEAIDDYENLQTANGGDVHAGRKLSGLLESAGFENLAMYARYEVYESLAFIGEYLALQLERADMIAQASTLRRWAAKPNGMFAQAWVSCLGRKPVSGA